MKTKYKRDNKMRVYGDTDFDKHVVRINKKMAKTSGKKGELLDTIVHETFHVKHPKATEKATYKKTPKIIKKMSRKQKQKMYAKVK